MKTQRLFTTVTLIWAFLILIGFYRVAETADWPQWKGPNRDGKSSEKGLLKKWPEEGPKLLWSADVLGQGYSTVSIAKGIIYTTGMINKEGFLFAFDLNGKLKWKKPYGPEWTGSRPGARSTPTIDGDRIYIFSGRAGLYCLDAKTGEAKWSVDTLDKFGGRLSHWGVAESVLIDGNTVFCTPGGKNANVVALNKMTGETIWITKELSEKAGFCSPIIVQRGSKRLVVTMLTDSVVGIDVKTGKLIWRKPIKSYTLRGRDNNPNTPIYLDGEIYTTSGYSKGSVMIELSSDGSDISTKWHNRILDVHHGGVAVVDGYIYGSRYKGNWVCLDWKSGEVKYETDQKGKGSIIAADGMLYCYDEKKGTVRLIKATPEKYEIISSFTVTMGAGEHWAHPVILDGTLYIRHGDTLMAYNIKAK